MDKQNIQPPQEEIPEKKLPEKGNDQSEAVIEKQEPPKPLSTEEKGTEETIGVP